MSDRHPDLGPEDMIPLSLLPSQAAGRRDPRDALALLRSEFDVLTAQRRKGIYPESFRNDYALSLESLILRALDMKTGAAAESPAPPAAAEIHKLDDIPAEGGWCAVGVRIVDDLLPIVTVDFHRHWMDPDDETVSTTDAQDPRAPSRTVHARFDVAAGCFVDSVGDLPPSVFRGQDGLAGSVAAKIATEARRFLRVRAALAGDAAWSPCAALLRRLACELRRRADEREAAWAPGFNPSPLRDVAQAIVDVLDSNTGAPKP